MAFERLFSNLLREIYAVFCKKSVDCGFAVCGLLPYFGLFYHHMHWMISDLKSYLFDLGLAAALSVSCSSSLGELLLLSQRAAAPFSASFRRCSSQQLLSQRAAAAAPLSVSCCCCSSLWAAAAPPLSASCYSSLGELLLLSQRTATPLGELLLSSEAALLVYYCLYEMFRQTTVIQMLWCYCDINIFLKIPIVL
jgi:hypothetical protein